PHHVPTDPSTPPYRPSVSESKKSAGTAAHFARHPPSDDSDSSDQIPSSDPTPATLLRCPARSPAHDRPPCPESPIQARHPYHRSSPAPDTPCSLPSRASPPYPTPLAECHPNAPAQPATPSRYAASPPPRARNTRRVVPLERRLVAPTALPG